jgi:Fic-DOC domain mobile mystery protein B
MTKTTPIGATSGPDLSGLRVSAKAPEEINELEAANILEATTWASKSRKLRKDLLTASGLLELHRRMFGKIWNWAGKIREENLNIGVKFHEIQNELGRVLGDVKYWLEHETYPLDEICMRFHHELTRIHPFKNGNGRFARIAANLLCEYYGGNRFTWGSVHLGDESPNRAEYVKALKKADIDKNDIKLLVKFARS